MRKIFLLVSILCVSLSVFAGIDMQAHVASDEGKAAYTDYLAKQAAYYKGDYVYSSLIDQTGTPLFGLLNTLMGNTSRIGSSSFSYNSLRDNYIKVDRDLNDASMIIGYYDGCQMEGAWGSHYNREHTWPQSKGANKSTPMGHDMQSVRPTNVAVNSDRGNTAYGESGSYYDPDEVNIDNVNYKKMNLGTYRGDCARVILYDYVVYGQNGTFKNALCINNAQLLSKLGSSGVFESLAVLLKWHMQDPPSLTEMVRNDGAQNYQGNRNPFIDFPELAINMLKNESKVTAYSVTKNTTANVNPNYTFTTPAGFISYLTFADGSHPKAENLTVSGGSYKYDETLGRLIISSASGSVNITTENDPEATAIENVIFADVVCFADFGEIVCANLPENCAVRLLDISGRMLEVRNDCAERESFEVSNGVYLVQIVQNGAAKTFKVVK